MLPPFAGASRTAPSDRIRFATIGCGTRGSQLPQASLQVPGVECVGVSDLYDGRLQAAREYLKREVMVTKDYRRLLDRKDIDAVMIAATDHQHSRIVQDACAAGKDIYCEKPLSHKIEEGFVMVDAAQTHGRVLQVGSQRVSSILFAKAKDIYDSGRLGQVCAIEAYTDRATASGAWVYPVPPDASEQTIDWSAFLGTAPKPALRSRALFSLALLH